MKKIIFVACMLLTLCVSAYAGPKGPKKLVVYQTSLHCKNCAAKIADNVSFEKGVKDLKTDVDTKKVTIVFDSEKTDTLKLANAIRKLGYTAKVVEFKDAK